GPPRADPRRFARVFQATLTAIPEADRRRIIAHWRAERARQGGGRVPVIELTDELGSGTAVGDCSPGGLRLRFLSVFASLRITDAIRTTAHEIAHVFRYATGEAQKERDEALAACRAEAAATEDPEERRKILEAGMDEFFDGEEGAVEAVLERWGFEKPDPDPLAVPDPVHAPA